MSVRITSRVWEQSVQKDSALLLTLALADNANDDGICWPSTDYLRDKIRMSVRQTQRLLDKLEESAEIFVSRPEAQGRGATNHYIVLAGMTDEQIDIAFDDLGIGQKGDKNKGDILQKGDILTTLKCKRMTFLTRKGDIPDLENLPDFSLIGKRQEVRRKRITVNRTVNNNEPSIIDSEKSKSPKKKSEPKPKPERKPSSDLTDAMWKGIPEEIRLAPKPHYGKNSDNAELVFNAGFTPEQVTDFVAWTYATNDWYWTGGKGGVPVIISMNGVLNGIRLSMGKVKQWIADGKPNLTGRAQQTAKVEKPFDPETDPNNPKNWPFTPRDPVATYEQYKKDLEIIHGIYDYTPPELHKPGGENQVPVGAGTDGTQSQQPRKPDLSIVPKHGSGDSERTS